MPKHAKAAIHGYVLPDQFLPLLDSVSRVVAIAHVYVVCHPCVKHVFSETFDQKAQWNLGTPTTNM